LISGLVPINAETKIPNWVRNNAKLWNQDQISDSEFVQGLQYMIENKIIILPSGSVTNQNNKIPSWIKNNAGLWSSGAISDDEFVSGIQYLVSSGIIVISSSNETVNNSTKCDQFATAAEKETCVEQLEYDNKIKKSIQTSTPYVVGPITFYYVDRESQKTGDGKTILTLHFVVKNNSDHEVTMTCITQDSCNYLLSDGQNYIPYSTNTLVYGSLTLVPNNPKFLDWTFYSFIDQSKNYSFLIKEQWGSGSIPIKIS
jgi:hypothetical protein